MGWVNVLAIGYFLWGSIGSDDWEEIYFDLVTIEYHNKI